jgi:precorrin-4 methylase
VAIAAGYPADRDRFGVTQYRHAELTDAKIDVPNVPGVSLPAAAALPTAAAKPELARATKEKTCPSPGARF